MPLDTFAPPINPSINSSRPVKPRVNKAQFGDGYSQRSQDGLNTSVRMPSMVWQMLGSTDADTMEEFFDAHTVTPFLWTLPLDIAERKWIAKEWTRGYLGADLVSLTVSLEEVFDL